MNDVNTAPVDRPAYQVRVIEEKAALDDKIGKLKAFVDGPTVLNDINRSLLRKQLRTMEDYSTTLGERIEGFDA